MFSFISADCSTGVRCWRISTIEPICVKRYTCSRGAVWCNSRCIRGLRTILLRSKMRLPTPFSKIAFPLLSNFARFYFYLIRGFSVITWFLRLQSNFVEYRWWRSIVVRPSVLAGELSLSCARLMAGRVRYQSTNMANSASHPSGVG